MTTSYGTYRGKDAILHFRAGPDSAVAMVLKYHPYDWHLPFQGLYPYGERWRVQDVYLGDMGPPNRQTHYAPFHRALRQFQRAWRRYGGARGRARKRSEAIKEELMAAAWAPRRVAAWLDAGMELEAM